MTQHQIKIKGLRIAYQRAGEGPALVLLHGGFGISSSMWRPQLDRLSDEFTVVAWDMPGCGHSSDPPEGFGASDYVDCLVEFIKALGLERPHVLGLSFGGVLALELFRWHPTVPRSLVLASAYAGWVGSLPAEVVEQRLQRALREADLPPEQWVRGYIPGFFTEAAPTELIEEMAAMMSEPHPAGLKAIALAFGKADLRDVLPRIDVPTLLLYGDKDVRSPLNVAEDLHAQIPGSTLVVMPGIGHVSNMEAPERFNAEVRNFLREVGS
jgi:pimeloyl-ACP methyl ester carboxylesterase